MESSEMSICDPSSIVAQKVASVKQPKEQWKQQTPRRPDGPKEPACEIRQNGLLVPRCTSAIQPKCTRSSIMHRVRKELNRAQLGSETEACNTRRTQTSAISKKISGAIWMSS